MFAPSLERNYTPLISENQINMDSKKVELKIRILGKFWYFGSHTAYNHYRSFLLGSAIAKSFSSTNKKGERK